ncbi:MAG: glycosyltransferase family 4 protein, partial [Dehalococcoidia bacterium]|nr:glycosyltransferase family 4 protein [Dehalococcoidia bacterium]
MKIALVSPYDFAYPGGVARHITCLDKHFTGMGHQVKIIAPSSGPVDEFGGRFIRLGTPHPVPSSGSIARVTLSLNLDSKIKALLDEEKFDIIHMHEPLVPTLCTSMLRLSDTVNIGTFHAFNTKPSYRWAQPFAKLLMERWYRRLHGKIAVSQPAQDFANKHFRGTYHIIPNGIDVKHFSPDVPPIEEFCDGKLNILFVGRMEKRKGVRYLLQAYPQVKQKFPNSRLIIVGPGTRLRHKYEKYVGNNGLKDVVFTGLVSYKDLPRYYKCADVFCAPATGAESFGIILLEAMAVGKPVVATNIPGYASVVTDGE